MPSDKLAPAKIDRVESNTSIVTDNEEVKCQRTGRRSRVGTFDCESFIRKD